ncbi:type II toxin-antitoxin system HicA family toxin [Candidatus Berkelbacteria bacterium]|nr:type II toxin-antitoxin system HicA family toxin [Candidatus Berkelbacteria bacterium]
MPMKPISYREARRRLLKAGFLEIGQRGSHVKFGKRTVDGFLTATVPHHRDVAPGTLRSILRQAGLTWEQFHEL